MSKFNSTHTFTVAAAFGAAAVFSMLSFGNSAEASGNPLSCHGSTAKKVMECCAEALKNRPSWMIKTGKNCHTSYSVTCKQTHSTANYPCYLRPRTALFFIMDETNTKDSGTSSSASGRGPNSSNSH